MTNTMAHQVAKLSYNVLPGEGGEGMHISAISHVVVHQSHT
jgi:hypothetical protein